MKVRAGLDVQLVERPILVKLTGQQNGADPSDPEQVAQIADDVAELTAGGGVGGVGGEGLGGPVDDATLAALAAPVGDGSAEGLRLLYPYDGTVWPRGILAPLLQWESSLGDADAIEIDLETTSGSLTWKGTFAKPAILAQTGKPFVRHPIPQPAWRAAIDSAGGADQLMVRLTVEKGGQAYGPIAQTWTVAAGRLSGVIYYNSYGTQLAKNYAGAVGGDGKFGGAVLSIHVGDSGPALVAGANGGDAQCRVCHSVAAFGSRLVAQHGDNSAFGSAYDLSPNGANEVPLAVCSAFPAMYPDGSMLLSAEGQLRPLPDDAVPLAAQGLAAFTLNLGTPSFSPDGKKVVVNPMAGPVPNPMQKLAVVSFDPATLTFSNPVIVVDDTGQPAERRPGWPAFLPDGQSVVYQQQIAAGADGNFLGDLRTRKGAKAFISWTSALDAASVTPLDRLNGKEAGDSYLPSLAQPIAMSCTGDFVEVGGIDAGHVDDANLNYEPTVSPVASGGYAWIVFTSRRRYGSVAQIPPFCSDPRGVDLVQNVTPKKLWVAAIDLGAAPGQDASHPAFYLPGQELLAGNSRGFWVLDPCKPNGGPCDSGDECCGGYCEPDPSGALVCGDTPLSGDCSQPQEVCETAADCCDPSNLCINGFCSDAPPG